MAGYELPGGLASYHRPVAVDVETSIEIECPRSVVAAFVSNPENATQWYVNIKSITWETTPPAVVGSRIAFVAQFLGRRIAYTYEVREIAPGERFVMSTAQGPFPMQTTYSWQDTESGGTRMTLRNSGEPSGFGKMAAPMMAAAMRKGEPKGRGPAQDDPREQELRQRCTAATGGSGGSMPIIRMYPPSGTALVPYSVSSRVRETPVLPNPTMYWVTRTPNNLAVQR